MGCRIAKKKRAHKMPSSGLERAGRTGSDGKECSRTAAEEDLPISIAGHPMAEAPEVGGASFTFFQLVELECSILEQD